MTLPPILIPAPDGDGTGTDQEIHWLPAPRAAEETGLGLSFLEELALKVMTREREFTTRALADALALSAPVVDEIFQRLRKGQLIEVTGLVGTMYRATLSGAGRARAEALLTTSQYVGPAPVPLGAYTERVRTQLVTAAPVRPEQVRRAFDSLVLHPDAVRQIGIAIASGAPLMLFGPERHGQDVDRRAHPARVRRRRVHPARDRGRGAGDHRLRPGRAPADGRRATRRPRPPLGLLRAAVRGRRR
jgi:hypothetical protein